MGEVDDGPPGVLGLVLKVSLTSLRGGPTTSRSGNRLSYPISRFGLPKEEIKVQNVIDA
jgi:hypothetical protein